MGKHGTQQHRRFDSPAYGTLDRTKLDLPDPDPVVERDCLRCGRSFLSQWRGNRLCPACRGRVDAEDGGMDCTVNRNHAC